MASASNASLTIAKVSLTGALSRLEPTSCSRQDTEHFLALVDSAITQCSLANVQKCKNWIVKHAVAASSKTRITALGKYLCAVSKSFPAPDPATTDSSPENTKTELSETISAPAEATPPQKPSAKRKRLHILYIINDVLHHLKKMVTTGSDENIFIDEFKIFLPTLFASAAAFRNCPKHKFKLHDLVNIWSEKAYYSSAFLDDLRSAVEEGREPAATAKGKITATAGQSTSKPGKEAPFIMPALHGSPSTPWYDLPAGNWLPILEPNSTRPLDSHLVKPLRFVPGPADNGLVDAVKQLLLDVNRIYGATDDELADLSTFGTNRMGERVELDPETSEIVEGDTYYGWSRTFCRNMKERRRKQKAKSARDHNHEPWSAPSRSASWSRNRNDGLATRRGPSRDRSRSRSRSSSRPAFKRRRMSRSPYQRDPDRGRNRSWSRSRSPGRLRDAPNRSQSRGRHQLGRSPLPYAARSRSRSPQCSRSRSRPPYNRPPRRSPSPSRSRTAPPPLPPSTGNNQLPPPPFMPMSGGGVPLLPQMPFGINPNPSSHFQHPPPPPPIPPPPRPAGYQGPWPPPPPPLLPAMPGGLSQQGFNPAMVPPQLMGAWPPMPLPSLPLHQQQQHHPHLDIQDSGGGGRGGQYGYGYRGGRGMRGGGGGGGYGRGRGGGRGDGGGW